MASLVSNSNNAFTRSHSSSDIPKLITFDFERPEPAIGIEELTRSASYTCLSVLESDSYFPLKDYLAADVAPAQPEKVSRSAYKLVKNGESKAARPQDERPNLDRLGRRQSLVAGPRSWLQRVKSSPERKATLEREPHVTQPPIPIVTTYSRHKSTTSESFVNFASRSWVSSSRSPSPGTSAKIDIDDRSLEEDDSTAASSISSSSPPKSFVIPVNLDNVSPGKSSDNSIIGFGKKSSGLLRKSKRPQVEYADNSSLRSVTLLGNSSARGSIENFDSPRGSTEALPVSTLSKDKLSSLGIEATHRKDELWSVFRALEIDFQKFHAKPSALRTNVVRSTLLPFFRNYAQHPSIKNLRPEDLDRRVNILNKWWRGLLEMLDGHHSQSVSGTDRPVVLDAIIGIMTRPEWRLAPSYVPPLNDRSTLAGSPLVRTRSSGTLDWTTSQSLAESVYHNVRNKFIHNLESQMSMVVEKMSLRHAPASLVTFCGKAVAYAFFFCPGVADILVRLWKTPLETIRRVADEFGLVRRVSNNSSHDDVVAEFPPSLHVLGWTSSKALAKHLRHSTDLPPKGAKIPWHGPWATRWCGRDSDLFFVFCKHYHILMEDFLPPDAPLIVKARAPGFVLVHAQILKVLDGTIHRHSSSDAGNGSNSLNFDDVLSGLDASAAALPRPPGSNVARHMAENRLIMLLRDFISERASDFVSARHTFAEAFGNIARASAKRTSLYDHNGCFILCDFLEEALGIYMKFQHANPDQNGYIDWRFWLDVCRKVLVSQNSMSEIRLFSFIFGSWSTIEADERRKEILCVEWLLSADVFQEYFLHWCPMVRAYYMRLLCWRVCRFDGEASQLNTKILSLVSDRLKLVWSHYLYLKQIALRDGKVPPSSAPCYPAPGRRLLIVRNNGQSTTGGLFLSFDGIVPPPVSSPSTAARRHSLAGLPRPETTDVGIVSPPIIPPKKKWSLFGKILPFNSSNDPGHGSNVTRSAPPSPTQKSMLQLEQVRQATASSRTRPVLNVRQRSSSSGGSSDSAPSTPSFRSYSFKFSLEWYPGATKEKLHFNKNRKLSSPKLPTHAQAWIASQVPGTEDEVPSMEPVGAEIARAKYAGRALAEWTLLIMECNNFVERRRGEGVPSLKLTECPTLGVDAFRKYS